MPQDFLNVDVAKHKRATNDICLTTMQHRKILAAFSFCAHIKWHKTFSSCCILGFQPKGIFVAVTVYSKTTQDLRNRGSSIHPDL